MVAASRPRTAYSLTDTTPARTVWIYRNGDPFYLARRFVINHRYVRTFEAFIIQLNEGVPTPFGVRNVYTPREGHSVKDLPELQSGGKYVAAGKEKFRKLNYFGIGAKKPQRKKKDEIIQPVVHSKIQVPSKWQSFYNPQIINVFTNGDTLIAPVKILIPRFILTKWDQVLGMINEKVILRCGGIHRLYTLHGHLVHGPEELEDNQFYIACSKEKFQSLRYWQHPKVPDHIRRNFDHRTPKLRKSPKRKPSVEQPKGERRSVFYARSKKARPEAVPKELSSEDGRSVFKAEKSQKETEEAQEVQDARDVQIDLPVDQTPAEIVQEEDIYANYVQEEDIYASTENLAEKVKEDVQMKEDDQYEDQNNQAKKGLFRTMVGFLQKPSKKKGGETESKTKNVSVGTSDKEPERSDPQKDSANMQRLQSMQKVTGDIQGTGQNGMTEEKKEQDAMKQRQSSSIKRRDWFDENDYD